MAKIMGSGNYSIKQVTLGEEKVNIYGENEPFLLPAEMEDEVDWNRNEGDEGQLCASNMVSRDYMSQ